MHSFKRCEWNARNNAPSMSMELVGGISACCWYTQRVSFRNQEHWWLFNLHIYVYDESMNIPIQWCIIYEISPAVLTQWWAFSSLCLRSCFVCQCVLIFLRKCGEVKCFDVVIVDVFTNKDDDQLSWSGSTFSIQIVQCETTQSQHFFTYIFKFT